MLISILSSLCYGTMALCGGLALKTIFIDEDIEEEAEEVQTTNILKYKYYPVENIIEENKDNKILTYTFIEGEKEGVKACIGQDVENNLISIDMLEGHIVVGGASRWGKSSFLNVFITNLMRTYTDNEICLFGCDFKKSDVYYFRNYKHFRRMSTTKEQFLDQINCLEKIIEKRAKILDEENCRNVINYNKTHDKKMSYIIFVIDELIQLVSDNDCKRILHNFMSKCASYGIYFVLATQDLTKETVGKCKMNCSQIIGFHTFDETDSNTLIGKGGNLQDITVKGRCKIKNSEGIRETQIFYISEDEIEEVLRPYLKESEN
jgi:S-DNA-T family DNA segregation ATPase FtsK/SpoIIIE